MGACDPRPSAQEGAQAARRAAAVKARSGLTSEGLPRSWRITRGEELRAVLKTATRRRTPRLEIAWRANQTQHPRLGLIVPRFGQTAVARNRLRRRLREFARRRVLPTLPPLDLVIRSRRAAYTARPDALADDIDQWLDSLSR